MPGQAVVTMVTEHRLKLQLLVHGHMVLVLVPENEASPEQGGIFTGNLVTRFPRNI